LQKRWGEPSDWQLAGRKRNQGRHGYSPVPQERQKTPNRRAKPRNRKKTPEQSGKKKLNSQDATKPNTTQQREGHDYPLGRRHRDRMGTKKLRSSTGKERKIRTKKLWEGKNHPKAEW